MSQKLNNNKFALNDNNKLVNSLLNTIKQKEDEINILKEQLKHIPKQKKVFNIDEMVTVNFISSDSKIHFAIPCIKSNIFAEIEEKLYEQYPEYRETNNYFLANGTQVKRFKTIEYNNIGSGLPVELVVPSD